MDKTMIAAYVRVSTEEQVRDGLSIEGQIQSIKKYCELYNKNYKLVFFIDKGYSGKNMHRKELIAMLKDIHEFDQLVVWKLDRLSRSLADSVMIIDELLEKHVDLISIEEKIDCGSPTGRAFINIIMTFAQLEVENTSERTKLGLLQKARNGEYPFSVLPYGYILNNKRKLVPNKETRTLIKNIYFLYYKKNLNPNQICFRLQKKYQHFSKKQLEKIIHRVLKNRIYIGEFRYQGELHNNVVAEAVITDKYYRNVSYHSPEKTRHRYTKLDIYCSCGKKLYNSSVVKSNHTYKYKCCSRCNKRVNIDRLLRIIDFKQISNTNNELNNSKTVRYVYDFKTNNIEITM